MKTILIFCLITSCPFLYLNDLLSQSITAKYNKSITDSLAYILNPAAKLVKIDSDSVTLEGTSFSWHYHYSTFTGYNDTSYFFHTTVDSVFLDSLNTLRFIGISYIKKSWIDSDSAIAAAENQGGAEFRNNNPDYKITATLVEPLVPNSTPRWYIDYISAENSSNKLFINIDATENPVSYENDDITPADFHLFQNYPNPFNPVSTIEYTIPKAETRSQTLTSGRQELEAVKLIVYDILGREIAILVNKHQKPGNYKVLFDGSSLPGGVYFYKIASGKYSEIKKMVLLK